MSQRYVRVKGDTQEIFYGLLQLDRTVTVFDAPPWLDGQPTELELNAESYQIIAPCAPSKIIAVGKNYRNHAAEMGSEVPSEPILFLKPPTSITPTETPILYPTQSQRVDYEGELAVVIGDRATYCSLSHAPLKIWGYTIANDVTARDLQKKDGQWTRAKGFDTFCPLGPWIVRELTPDAQLQTYVNGDLRQSAFVNEMVFGPDFLVSYISHIMTLLPGDIILTGTPAGIGPVEINDHVRVTIEGIGQLDNFVTKI